jgi:translation elongation factor EF-G
VASKPLNLAILAHVNAGKTTLTKRQRFAAGGIYAYFARCSRRVANGEASE